MAKAREMKKQIISLLGKEGGRPLNKSELARELQVSSNNRRKLRETLFELVEEGEIFVGKKGRYVLSGAGRSLEGLIGKLKLAASGHGWFFPDPANQANLASGIDLTDPDRYYVSPRALDTALDGDLVRVRLTKSGHSGGQRDPQGLRARVVEVVERRSGKVTGVFVKNGKWFSIRTDDERVPPVIRVNHASEAKTGQLVAVKITEWKNSREIPIGEITEVLGWPGDPGVDVDAIVHHHGINATFAPEVIAAAQAISQKIAEEEIERRDDWRQRDVITIDPKTAKDFDDAIWVGRTPQGWQLAVHIADVSFYVKPGSVLDLEARERGNSTYLVDRVIPMQPEELCNGICSRVPQEDRLTKCALMDFDLHGELQKVVFTDAVICTPRKFTYEEAQKILTRPGTGGRLGERICEAWKLASILRKRRFARGGLDLEMPEVSILLDDQGVPTGCHLEEYNESHQLIEECMLAANEAVARAVKNARRPSIYRIHEDPDPDKLSEFSELAREYGYQVGDLSNRHHIQDLLNQAKGKLEEPAIKLGLLKSLKRAVYGDTPAGHYGLAKSDYCHFTSPIRRYADLVMHRALQPLLENRNRSIDRSPDAESCQKIAQHLSNTERTSADAESESRRMKMLEWLELDSRKDQPTLFNAVVTEVRVMGVFIECIDILQRGLVKREDFTEGRWFFEANLDRFSNSRGFVLQAGSRLKVLVESVDRIGMKVDFKILKILGGSPIKKARVLNSRQVRVFQKTKASSGVTRKPPKKVSRRRKKEKRTRRSD